jgi:hypothetical protein
MDARVNHLRPTMFVDAVPELATVSQQPPVNRRPVLEKTLKHRTSGWQKCACPNVRCAVDTLVVRRLPDHDDLWWIARAAHDRPWQVAAVVPICPFCATTLVAIASWEEESTSGEGEARVA